MTFVPVFARSAVTVASTALCVRPLTTTSHPACASASAHARPRPRLDAQTIALRPEIPRSIRAPSLPRTTESRRQEPSFEDQYSACLRVWMVAGVLCRALEDADDP